MIRPTIIAAPLFAICIAVEAYISARNDSHKYEKKDTWTNIGLGFLSLFFGGGLAIIQLTVFNWANAHSFYTFDMTVWWHWAILIVGDDFCYYWFHRFSHERRFLWNLHVVHHSSNRYNLSVAVRQSWFSGIAHWMFYFPLGFMGFPYWAFVVSHGINLIYQFWIHTEYIHKLGKFEWIFNTPSQHRVHHGMDPQYLDKNYGGIFSIWDRLFGTFVEEKETPNYGTIKPLNSYNMLWINTHGWVETWKAMKKAKTLKDKLKCWYGPPGIDHIPGAFDEDPKPNLIRPTF